MAINFFISKKEYEGLRTLFQEEISNCESEEAVIEELSAEFTEILGWKLTMSFCILEIIWFFHQYRINPLEYGPIVLAFRNIAFQQNAQYEYMLDSDEEGLDLVHYQQVFTSLVAIVLGEFKEKDVNMAPSIAGCLSVDERKGVNAKLREFEEIGQLDDQAIELEKTQQGKVLGKFSSIPEFSKYNFMAQALLEIATSEDDKAIPALAAINYFLDQNDIVPDKLGILGLVDDIYAITLTLNSIYSKNRFHDLIGHHDLKYPHFRLPNIGSAQEFFSLVNLEDIVKASYTNLEGGALKRLLVVPDVGPLPVLIALGKSITDRIKALKQTIEKTTSRFKEGDHILFGYSETTTNKKAMVQKYIGPWERNIDLFWCEDSDGSGQSFRPDEIKKCFKTEEPLSKGKAVKKFLKNRETFSPWGAINFSPDINEIDSNGKIFLIGRKTKMMELLEEEIYGKSISSWLGIRYIGYNKKRNWKHTDSQDVNQLFPEPQIYLIADKNLAIDILNDRWEDQSIRSECSLVICAENSFLKDDYFLGRLNNFDGDTIVLNEYFNNDENIQILEYGFEQLSARPDNYYSSIGEGFISSPMKRFFSRTAEFKTKLIPFPSPLQDNLRIKTRIVEQEDLLLKYKLANLNYRLFQQIMTLQEEEKIKLNETLNNVIGELEVLGRFKPKYISLKKFLEENKDEIMNISRLEALEAHLDADKEYMVLAKRKEVVNLNNYFQQNSIKAKALTFNELEVQENIKHLLIPVFMGKRETQKLRNFRYAKNHYFLVTQKEKEVHNLMQKHEEKLFNNTFSESLESHESNKYEEEVINVNELEEKINDINPLSDLIQDTISRIHRTFKSENEIHNVDAKLIILEGLKVLPLPEGGHTLKLSSGGEKKIEYLKVESIDVGDNIIISPHISGNDLLHLMLKEDEGQYKEYLSVEKKAKNWQLALKNFSSDNDFTIIQLKKKLKDIGINRDISTIRSWISNPDTLAPRNYEQSLEGIFRLTGDYTQSKVEETIHAIKLAYQSRRKAQERLISILESTKISSNNNRIRLNISGSEFLFFIYNIESISSASIEPKYLYKLIDFSDLEDNEIV